ncbi:hypothetical protein P8452_55803 [Trifolium repens]|nr:hypothetical protein P8452_55803 [Trifolium repens]
MESPNRRNPNQHHTLLRKIIQQRNTRVGFQGSSKCDYNKVDAHVHQFNCSSARTAVSYCISHLPVTVVTA